MSETSNKQRTVLVTGASGMLGQDLCPLFEDAGWNVIETTRQNLDITNETQVLKVIGEHKPDVVVHCAAYTNVDGAEDDFHTAELVNSKGTEYIAKCCALKNITLVYISTDYVFDGTKNTPYEPSDITNPINKYGLTKLQGEQAVQKYCSKYYIVRTSWLYGHHGKNFVETMLSLAVSHNELKVVDDQIGCPTWTVDLADGILSILDNSNEYGIYHICGSECTSWFEFAKEIFRLAKLNVNLVPCTTNEFPRPAKRPKYSVMDNAGILRNWKKALKEYIELRVE